MSLTTSEIRFGITHREYCGSELCQIEIVTLTNATVNKVKEQVYLSGALHGNEVIGPNACYYFIEYILSQLKQGDPVIKHLMDNIEIIITPMTNAVGYYHNEREERVKAENERG